MFNLKLYCKAKTLFVGALVFTSNRITIHHSQFYTVPLSARQLLFSVNEIINSITQNDLIVHLIMQVIFNQ